MLTSLEKSGNSRSLLYTHIITALELLAYIDNNTSKVGTNNALLLLSNGMKDVVLVDGVERNGVDLDEKLIRTWCGDRNIAQMNRFGGGGKNKSVHRVA
ncbi:hypothetical protein NQ176_g10403 [Zarea fungicola]|uniref:Uncharacterized protein n=1 Tax=Zarea fungicola TaxID=93591 RepID=A0ACC1MGN9_9HYPO|nr:hypothetical protein NQ176_g10403 [Lecanicillium fungicola]